MRTAGLLLVPMAMLPQLAAGSLVIAIYSNQQIFLGSDSLSVVSGNGTNIESRNISQKIFTVSSNCCASITGCYGSEFSITHNQSHQGFRVDLANTLGQICSSANGSDNDISNIVNQFSKNYIQFIQLEQTARKSADDIDSTRVCFWGYDSKEDRFWGSSYVFHWTNDVAISQAFDSKQINGFYIGIQGEDKFLPSVIRADGSNINLRSSNFSETLQHLNSTGGVADQDMVNMILEMFQLHKKYAHQLSSEKG